MRCTSVMAEACVDWAGGEGGDGDAAAGAADGSPPLDGAGPGKGPACEGEADSRGGGGLADGARIGVARRRFACASDS